MLKRLTNNSAVVLCMCRRKLPDYKQKRENCDRLDDFEVDLKLRPEQRISVCCSLCKKPETVTVKAVVVVTATTLPKADAQELGSDQLIAIISGWPSNLHASWRFVAYFLSELWEISGW